MIGWNGWREKREREKSEIRNKRLHEGKAEREEKERMGGKTTPGQQHLTFL